MQLHLFDLGGEAIVQLLTQIRAMMDRYPAAIYLGAGLLGKVGGEMVLTDPFIARTLDPSTTLRYAVEGALVIILIAVGRKMCARVAAEPKS